MPVCPQAATSFASTTYAYDDNGNLSSKDDGSVVSTYFYDWNDRLGEVKNDGVSIATYDYTDERQRLAKTVASSTTYYLNNFAEYDGTNYQDFVFAGNNRVASIDNSGITYNHTDHLQSSSLQTNTSGAVTSASIYRPFGSTEEQIGTNAHDYTFTDQESDEETGLMYYDARYYDTDLKRFTSVDPVAIYDTQRAIKTGPQTLNTYSYVSNNPLRYNDPTGEWWKEVITGQQSLGDFQLEVGQATQRMTSDNQIWDYAVSNPYETSAAVAIGSGAALVGGATTVVNGLVTVKKAQLEAGTLSIVSKAIETLMTGYLTTKVPDTIQGLQESYVNAEISDPTSIFSAVKNTSWVLGQTLVPEEIGFFVDMAETSNHIKEDIKNN